MTAENTTYTPDQVPTEVKTGLEDLARLLMDNHIMGVNIEIDSFRTTVTVVPSPDDGRKTSFDLFIDPKVRQTKK